MAIILCIARLVALYRPRGWLHPRYRMLGLAWWLQLSQAVAAAACLLIVLFQVSFHRKRWQKGGNFCPALMRLPWCSCRAATAVSSDCWWLCCSKDITEDAPFADRILTGRMV